MVRRNRSTMGKVYDAITLKETRRRLSKAIAVMAGYDAAQTTPENWRHWAAARDESAPQKITPEVRRKLRDRARYEADNNCYLSGMVNTATMDLIGPTGPSLSVLTPDAGLNTMVEQEWQRWSEHEAVNLVSKLAVLDNTKLVEGESFFNIFTDGQTGDLTGYKLNCNVISGRRVSKLNLIFGISNLDGNEYNDDGVYVDTKSGLPRKYHVLNIAEDMLGASLMGQGTDVDARWLKHWYSPKEPSQFRGVSEVAAALPLFAYLRRFTLATVSTAEIIAAMTAFLKTNQPPEEQSTVPPWMEKEIVRGMLNTLPEGWDIAQLDPRQPAATYEMFVNMILREIGRVLLMPYGVVAGDSSRYNYSSARLDYRGYEDRMKYHKQQLNTRILNPLFREWLVELAIRERQVAMALENGDLKHTWKYSIRPSVSPREDAQTDDIRLRNGTTTLDEIYSNRGLNWEKEIEQRKKETVKIEGLGMTFEALPIAEEIPEEETQTEDSEFANAS